MNNDQILNVIRQSVAHNDDNNVPNFSINFNDEKFHFSLNNSPQKIEITDEELLDVMGLYMKYCKRRQTEGVELVYRYDAIADDRFTDPAQLMFLRGSKNKKIILPDEYQGRAILNYAKECREWEFVINKLNPFYPFKNNCWLNSINTIGAKVFINLLSEKRYLNFNEMFLSSIAQSDSCLSSCTNILQPMSLLYSNLLFLIFSSTNIEDINRCADCVNIKADFKRIRNAIMHGTYFYDFYQGFEFYDGKIKDEEKLVHVGTLSFKNIAQLGRMVSTYKVKNNQDRHEYSIAESGFIESPHMNQDD